MIASSVKAEVVKANARGATDTGSPEVQVALLTARINAGPLRGPRSGCLKFGGQIKSFLLKRPKEAEAADDRWKMKIGAEGGNIVVKNESRIVQTITHDQLARVLHPNDLALVKTYEQKMNEYFKLWRVVYAEKDSSADPLVNAKVDNQLDKLIHKMRDELLGILGFLEHIGIHLDDHYHYIRNLVQNVQ